jgi:hypothetical protein
MGMWENLDLGAKKSLDWRVLEYAAFGEKDVPVDLLKQFTDVRVNSSKGAMFWRVIEALTPEERSALLKFATGRSQLPPDLMSSSHYFVVDDGNGVDKFPQSSTWFHQLHWPGDNTFQNALQMTRIAISFSGSFENA